PGINAMSSSAVCCQRGLCSSSIATRISRPTSSSSGLTRSAVSIGRPPLLLCRSPSLHFAFFGGATHQHLVEHRLPVLAFTQHPAQALDIFACASRTAQNDGNFGFRDIDAFVEHAGGHDHTVLPATEAIEDLLALSSAGL